MNWHIPAVWTVDRTNEIAAESAMERRVVLVVDDEPGIRTYLARVLQASGYDVVVAGGGDEALERFKQMKRCDLLLTDLMMPHMGGDELARRLRLEQPNLKILYLTGFSDRLFSQKVLLWEGEAFLEKPCSPRAVAEGVAMLVSGHTRSAVH